METREVLSTDKATVVIQINPQANDSVIYVDGQETIKHNAALKGFFKAQPKALGIVQIMIGVTVFLLGVVLTWRLTISDYYPKIVVNSGITYWGSFIYVSAGSLSVAAQNKFNPCLVKASLGMNVFSAITAELAILLMGVQLGISLEYPRFDVQSFILRSVGIMLVFTIPQFITSICISALACKATCNIHSTVVNVALNQVKASHGMNVFSAITSAIAILLTGNEIRIGPLHPRSCYNIHDCINIERFGFGVIGILLVFSILQFIISICISAFACKATCNNNYDSTVVNVELDQRY
ncbi:membrane-spanning 4-domains subfamily A member 4A-like [Sinocyclocheilus rhinocerous]|uniref:membrane-spanning 4-domains subfamily A member 4A-like n=1 Tax=Sinocyclocheilus rhinocerous TaxID=307959 RepID=UPI0007BA2E9C|nr:PREDICTED: membrane-spanning 4-domains subfamily A member 4A-like [Sinocyclocheilus rhinocerous]